MKRIILAALLAAPLALSAADKEFKSCSTKASMTTKKAELLQAAKVKEDEAKKAALATAGPGATIVKGGIETQDGCLVYAYHVKDPAKSGQNEIYVDAGTGAILKQDHESAARAALEKPVDKTKELAGKTKEKVTGEPSTNEAMANKKGG